MDKPNTPQKNPYIMDMEAGQYFWCACGRSKNQPLCDGSHKGSKFSPVPMELKEPKKVAWCGCKHTKTPPFCDGSHNKQ